MDVPRFLVCNLAAADFFMGVYLGNFLFSYISPIFNIAIIAIVIYHVIRLYIDYTN